MANGKTKETVTIKQNGNVKVKGGVVRPVPKQHSKSNQSAEFGKLNRRIDELSKEISRLKKEQHKEGDEMSNSAREHIKMLIAQMQNPEAVDTMGRLQGCPDPAAESLNTTLRTAVIDLELNPDSGGEFQVIFIPNVRGTVSVSGVTLGDQSTVDTAASSTEADIYNEYSVPTQNYANDVRRSPTYVPGAGCYVLYGSATYQVYNPYATIPLTFGNGDITTSTKMVDLPAGNQSPFTSSYYWSNDGSFGTTVATTVTFTTYSAVTTAAAVGLAMYGSTATVPTFNPAIDTQLWTVSNPAASTVTTGVATATNYSAYKSFWLGWKNTSGFQNTVRSLTLTYTGLTAVSNATTLVGTGSAFSYDAFETDPAYEDVRLVSASVLLQNRTSNLLAGGNVAEIMQHASLQDIASNTTYRGVTEEHQSHVGNLKDGIYAFWQPTSWEDWRKWKDPDEANLINQENTIVITGQAPTDDLGTATILHVRVYMIWQIITYDRKFNPQRKTYCNPDIPIGEYESIIYGALADVPECTCNPKHDDVTKFILNVKKVGKHGYKALKQLGTWGAYAAGVSAELFALL